MRELTVRVQDLAHGAGACVTPRRVPLDALVAFLFEGRGCEAVRALLARGAGTAHGARLSWPPVELSAKEFAAIERTFPQPDPARPLHADEVTAVMRMTPTAAGARASAAVATDDPVASQLATRARYVWFDYGEWADVWEADAPGADPSRPEFSVRYVAPRPGVRPPWVGVL